MLLKTGAFAAALSAFATMASAQMAATPDDAMAGAKNQLGILEYCQAEGHIDAAAVEIQERILTLLPEASDPAPVEAAYQKGKEGSVAVMGTEQSLADAAAAQGSDVAALCTQIAALVTQAGAGLPK